MAGRWKFIGDALMAVFGAQVAHEDDALRAVRAAAGLREQIAILNRGLEADLGVPSGLVRLPQRGP
jgi:class 3 adenylate cyclase